MLAGKFFSVKKTHAVRAYYILPCCLLLLNLVNNLISYKAETIHDPFLRVVVIIGLVLFGGSLVAFAVAPGLQVLVRHLHQGSRRGAGGVGEAVFLVVLGVVVFWLYYRMYIHGPGTLLPTGWRNPTG
jgi:hypothetical protein